jgi:hypothetical protein
MSESIDDRTDAAILNSQASDQELERAGEFGPEKAANPTVPSALICIPFTARAR